jgi:uncharacterized membrane protein YqhA
MSGVQGQKAAGGPEEPADGDSRRQAALAHKTERRFEASLGAARLLFVIPVVFLLLDAAAAFIYGASIFFGVAHDFLSGVPTARGHIDDVLGRFLLVMDAYLVGATLMIGAFGFYELFIVRHERANRHRLWLPAWLQMRDLDDLKARVVSMLILVAGTTFVDFAVESNNEQSVLAMGLGIAVVIAALTVFYWLARQPHPAPPRARELAGPPGGSGQADDSLDDEQHADQADRTA